MALTPGVPPLPSGFTILETPAEQAELEASTNPPIFDDGLIPVINEPNGHQHRHHTGLELAALSADCSISLDSSFHQLKGFCAGASESMRGELGVKKVKQQASVMGTGTKTAARCKHCLFELPWANFETDLQRVNSANYRSSGVGFRIRFLFKVHIPARRVDEQFFACPFCVHSRRTPFAADATVFLTHKQLLAHLARHPRPLPTIPGLVVIETAEVPAEHHNNYDLHFPASSPIAHPMLSSSSSLLENRPTAIATETFRTLNGALRSPADRAGVLQFAVGARIAGIEFPERYNGEWGIGWADGVKATFPMDCVRLRAPPLSLLGPQGHGGSVKSSRSGGGGTGTTAVTRWKRSPGKEKEALVITRDASGKEKREVIEWLKFDKGERITCITCK